MTWAGTAARQLRAWKRPLLPPHPFCTPARGVGRAHTLPAAATPLLRSLPPQLGLMPCLRALIVKGNPLRTIRRPILERGTPALLEYLRDRIPTVTAAGAGQWGC